MIINFDSASSGILDSKTIDFIRELLTKPEYYANPSSRHSLGQLAKTILNKSRESIAKTLQAQASEIIFTSGGTEANNLLLNILKNVSGKIIYFPGEHPSILGPLNEISKSDRLFLIPTPIKNHRLDLDKLPSLLNDSSALILSPLITELGDQQPLKEISKLVLSVKKNNPEFIWLGDGTGSHILPKRLGYDMLSYSSNKIGGINGTAILFKHHSLKLSPILLGGKQEFGLRAGTENLLAITCFAEIFKKYYQNYHHNNIVLQELKDYFLSISKHLITKGIINYNNLDKANNQIIHLSNFKLRGEDLMLRLSSLGIMVGNGNACNNLNLLGGSPTLQALEYDSIVINNSIRISLQISNRKSEIDVLIAALSEILNNLN